MVYGKGAEGGIGKPGLESFSGSLPKCVTQMVLVKAKAIVRGLRRMLNGRPHAPEQTAPA